jgi:hypothetical protein
MRIPRLTPLLAGAAAILIIAGCGDSIAPEVFTADDAEVLAARPESPGKKPPKDSDPGDVYDAYFVPTVDLATEDWGEEWDQGWDDDYWTDIFTIFPIVGVPGIATIVPLCFGDGWYCSDNSIILHGRWTTVVVEDPDYHHRSHRRFTMYHRLDIYQGPGWYGGPGVAALDDAVYLGGFTTSNSITCKAFPCSTDNVRLARKDWVPVEGDGLITSFDDGIVNLRTGSYLEEYGTDRVVVFRAVPGGIHGRVVFAK